MAVSVAFTPAETFSSTDGSIVKLTALVSQWTRSPWLVFFTEYAEAALLAVSAATPTRVERRNLERRVEAGAT
jgi:hypothetical protein